jgi:hypothetical protein
MSERGDPDENVRSRRDDAVAVARRNEKGRVERSIGFLRAAFFAARSFIDLVMRSVPSHDDLNAQADDRCRGVAVDRRWPGEPDRMVRAVFAEEAGSCFRPLVHTAA